MKTHQALRQKYRSASRLTKKLGHTLMCDGPQAAIKVLTTAFREYTPSGRRRSLVKSDFDRQNGVDTSGIVRIASMQISSPNYIYGTYYKASKADLLRAALQRLEIEYEKFTFVDYGSGKGLALLVAAGFPFRSVLGVEFGQDLHEIAEQNILTFRSSRALCPPLRSICGDAVAFAPPNDPLICYLYDPFEPPVTEQVIQTLTDSWKQNPRPILILFHGAGQDSNLRDAREKQEAAICGTSVFRKTQDWDQGTWSLYAADANWTKPGASVAGTRA